MNERLKKIAQRLEHDTYIDPMIGSIASDNFNYGVAQMGIEMKDLARHMEERYSEENRKASDAYAPTDKIAYLAGKRDAMTELLQALEKKD